MIDVRIWLALALLAAPVAVVGQSPKKAPTVGVVLAGPAECKPTLSDEAFSERLRTLGYVIGTTLRIDRKCYASSDEMRSVIAGLIAARVDVISPNSPQAALAARELTREIPIICRSCGDPLDNGLVTSLARPGGNVTGFASLSAELIAKRLALLKESVPGVARAAVIINPENPGTRATLKALEDASKVLRLPIERLQFRALGDIERALKEAAATGARAILIQDDPYIFAARRQIADLLLVLRLPASTGIPEVADQGVLMAYGPNREDLARRTAGYVDRILKGAKPGDLPFEQAERFDFVVNLKTAKAIGITIPRSILIQATRTIE